MLDLIIAENLTKTYRMGTIAVDALKGLDFSIPTGGFVSFVGPSGSGKTTLLNLIGCLDKPTSGALVAGTEVASRRHRRRALPGKAHRLYLSELQPDPGADRF